MGWIISLLGLAAAAAGGGAIYIGWPMVPLEKGWTLVIAGATLGSGGLVSFALAVQILETRRLRAALEKALARLAAPPKEAEAAKEPPPAAAPRRREEPRETTRPAELPPARPAPEAPRPTARGEVMAGDELQPARSFTVGETTFVVFTDGSIEARTAEGTKRFGSMAEVRAYLEAAVS
jgi:hypothetical protein